MSENNTDKNVVGSPEPTNDTNTLNSLKSIADSLGIKYHHKIGAAKLQGLITDFIKDQRKQDAELAVEQTKQREETRKAEEKEDPRLERMRLVKEATRLKRVQVACMNPNKGDWEGEIISASNSVVPTQKKYVQFNVPWHVPQLILNVMKERKCQMFKTVTRGKHKIREPYLINEFNITELPPLTQKEFEDLKKEQAMANRIG